MALKLNEKYKKTIVGFNNSGAPLGERDDLHLLVLEAERNPNYMKFFDEIPSDEEFDQIEKDYAEKHATRTQRRKIKSKSPAQEGTVVEPGRTLDTTAKDAQK